METHVDALALGLHLYGLEGPDVSSTSVLQWDCGDGRSLMAMACRHPGSQFVGVTQRPDPPSALADSLGLDNLRFVAEAPDGLYGFVLAGELTRLDPRARTTRLERVADQLQAEGAVNLSFATRVGVARQAVLRRLIDPGADEASVREWLSVVAEGSTNVDDRALAQELSAMHIDGIRTRLGPVWPLDHPEVRRDLAAAGLEVVGDTRLSQIATVSVPTSTQRAIARAPGDSEQVRDMLTGRRTREVWAVRSGRTVSRSIPRERVEDLYVGGRWKEHEEDGESVFRSEQGSFRTSDLVLAEAARQLSAAWPRTPAFVEWVASTAAATGVSGLRVRNALLRSSLPLHIRELLDLHVVDPGAVQAGPKPTAVASARLEAGRLRNLHHRWVEPSPQLSVLLPLMDGTRKTLALGHDLGLPAHAAGVALPGERKALVRALLREAERLALLVA